MEIKFYGWWGTKKVPSSSLLLWNSRITILWHILEMNKASKTFFKKNLLMLCSLWKSNSMAGGVQKKVPSSPLPPDPYFFSSPNLMPYIKCFHFPCLTLKNKGKCLMHQFAGDFTTPQNSFTWYCYWDSGSFSHHWSQGLVFWFGLYFTALQHILSHFGHHQLP